MRNVTSRHVTLRYGLFFTLRVPNVKLRCVALHYVTLRCIALRYVTLHYVTSCYRIRLERNGGAWCPKLTITKNTYEWLQIDLNEVKVIALVETQGRFGNGQVCYISIYVVLVTVFLELS